jgi:hypothetical protein
MSATEPILETETESTGLPAFPTWRGVYAFVVVFFAILVTLLVLLEKTFA